MELGQYNLTDLPDFSTVVDDEKPAGFSDGWYAGTVLGKWEFTDQNGNDRVFDSIDDVSQRGDSRNIRLQVELKRQSDGRTLHTHVLVNYVPEDLTQETVQAITAQSAKVKDGAEWGSSLFRAYMSIKRLGTLQRVAGVRQLQRSADGALDISPLFGKTIYCKLGPDPKNDKYKTVMNFSDQGPKGKKVSLL